MGRAWARFTTGCGAPRFGGCSAGGGVLLTGGTCHGMEGLSHGLAAQAGVEVLGAIVEETLAEDLDASGTPTRVENFLIDARTGKLTR